MTDYNKIQEHIQTCIDYLSEDRFSQGALTELQKEMKEIADITLDINDAVRDLDERVVILEAR